MQKRINTFTNLSIIVSILFFLASCSSLPLIGKKEEKKAEPLSEGKTITIEGMEDIKGVNPPKPEQPTAAKKLSPKASPSGPAASQTASLPALSFTLAPLPLFQMGLKKKILIFDFDNLTTYKEEKIGEIAARRLSERLEASQRVVVLDRDVVLERLEKSGSKVESLRSTPAMKRAYQLLGIHAFATGIVRDVGILSSKSAETSREEVSYATARVEVRLFDASTGNLLRTFIGRSPVFGTRESGELSRSKAVMKAIDLSLEEMMDGILRHIDFLDWTTSIARVEGDTIYINAGRLSGLRIGDLLEVFEPGREIYHPETNLSLGWTTGKLKGIIRVIDLFGVDAAAGKVVQGEGFKTDDVVKTSAR